MNKPKIPTHIKKRFSKEYTINNYFACTNTVFITPKDDPHTHIAYSVAPTPPRKASNGQIK